jgi:hypothetical protein
VLIDSSHRRWGAAVFLLGTAALVGHRALDTREPEPLTGGSFVGLWYGVVGTLLMVYAGLLAAHRRARPTRRMGSRTSWMRGHIWLGLLSVVFILGHSNYSWGGPLEAALWGVLIAVVASGVIGLILQQVLPRMLTSRVPCEAPYEQIPHLCDVMRRDADALVDNACGVYDPSPQSAQNTLAVIQYAGNARAQLRDFYEQDVRPFLSPGRPRGNPLANAVQAEARFSKLRRLPGMEEMTNEVTRLARFCEERRLLLEQERIHFWLHAWLLVHIPLSVALLVLGLLHVVTALYY